MIERIRVIYDGTAGPEEPGKLGAFAFVIFANDEIVAQVSGPLEPPPRATIGNSVAEYLALLRALEWLVENKKTYNHVRCYGDTLLIVNQLNKEYPFKSAGGKATDKRWHGIWEATEQYEVLQREVVELASKFRDIQFSWAAKKEILAARDLAEEVLLRRGVDPARITKEKFKAAAVQEGA